jgi:UMF1 family MFS transporter
MHEAETTSQMRPQTGWKQVFAWALYDWANSAFAATVMAVFFPVFFKEYASVGVSVGTSTFQLGIANSVGSLVIVALAPVLGAIADRGGTKKRFLAFFAFLGILMTGALQLVDRGDWLFAAALYVAGVIGFSGSNIFYDSLLISVAEERRVDAVSGLGYALGYLGGGLLLAVNTWMVQSPQTFGLADAAAATKASFVSVAVWWALFSLPILFFVHEPRRVVERPGWSAVGAGLRQLLATFRHVRQLRAVMLFLVGYWLYIDGLDTIVRMAVDFGLSLGFDAGNLVIAILITQFVGFPAAIAYGWLGQRIGPRRGIFIGLAVYMGVCVWGYFMDSVAEFYVMAIVVGLVQGGVQALSRSFYTRIIPRTMAGEFFGFYNMLGKFAVVLGPPLMGAVSVATGNPRYSILAIIVLFVIGAALLYLVDETKGRAAAEALERA